MIDENNIGMSWSQYCDFLMEINGVGKKSHLEKKKYHRPIIYFSRLHLEDHKGHFIARGILKIGKSLNPSSLMRGRNEPGGSIRIYAEIQLDSINTMNIIDPIIKNHQAFKQHNTKGPDNQTELYDYTDDKIPDLENDMQILISKHVQNGVVSVNLFIPCANPKPSIKTVNIPVSTVDNFFSIDNFNKNAIISDNINYGT